MINDPWYLKRNKFLEDNVPANENGQYHYLNTDNLKWSIYKTGSVPFDWEWYLSDDYWQSYNDHAKVAMLMVFSAIFDERHKIKNPIAISIDDDYWIHPGTQRYYIHQVCKDFELSAVIIDVSGYNKYKIAGDFSGVEPYFGDLDFKYNKNGNSFTIKPISIEIDTSYYKLEYEKITKLFDLDYSVEVCFNGEHFVTVPNNKPIKRFDVKGMDGLAQLSVHLLSDPDYEFEELYYEPL